MPEFNALLGLRSLEMLEEAARTRNETVCLYRDLLGKLPGIGFQEVLPGNRNSYKDFSITIDANAFGLTRDELGQALAAENIDTRKYYEPPVHRQTAYAAYADGQAATSHRLAGIQQSQSSNLDENGFPREPGDLRGCSTDS